MTQGEKEVKAGETNDRKKGLQFSAKKGQKCILLPISEWPAVLVLCNSFVASKVEMSICSTEFTFHGINVRLLNVGFIGVVKMMETITESLVSSAWTNTDETYQFPVQACLLLSR